MYRIHKKYLIVDGYNYINQDSGLKHHLETSLEAARCHLNDIIAEYCAFSGEIGTVVYDATRGERAFATLEHYRGIDVVYTKQGQTADTYIEILVSDILKEKTNQVRVITQDWAEQLVVLGSGGLRVSAKEFGRELRAMKSALTHEHGDDMSRGVRIDDIIDSETLCKLKQI